MERALDRISDDQDLAFFGAITASLSHQMNNVFTIINEVNGLLEDLLWASDKGGEIPPQKLREIADKIARHVSRGAEYVNRLNRFAHTTDQPEVSTDLGELLELAVALGQRFATLKNATLECQATENPATVSTSPFLMLQAVFLCLDIALQETSASPALLLRLNATQAGAAIVLETSTSIPESADTESKLRLLGDVMSRLGGKFSLDSDRSSIGLSLAAVHGGTE